MPLDHQSNPSRKKRFSNFLRFLDFTHSGTGSIRYFQIFIQNDLLCAVFKLGGDGDDSHITGPYISRSINRPLMPDLKSRGVPVLSIVGV